MWPLLQSIAQYLGLAPSARDRELSHLIRNSYSSVRVVGRGTIHIDPKEVRASEGFKKAHEAALSLAARKGK